MMKKTKTPKTGKPAKVAKPSKKQAARAAKRMSKQQQIEAAAVVASTPVSEPPPATETPTLVAGVPFTKRDMSYLEDAVQVVALLLSERFIETADWQERDGDIGATFFRAVHVVARSLGALEVGWEPIELSTKV